MSQEANRQLLEVDAAQTTFSIGDLALYFLRLGTLGFGGPIALAGHMQKDLVDERHWFSKQDYLEGLAFSQLSPGPLAAQLAMYLGWLRAGTLVATTVGIAFILPSFLMVLALAALYVHFGSLSWIQGMFYCICDYADVTFKPRPKLRGVGELNFEGFIFHAPDTNHRRESAAILRKSLRHQVHVLLASVR